LDDAKAEIKRLKDLLERSKSNRTDPSLNVSASNAQSTESDSSQSSTNLAVSEYLKKIKSLDENIRELHKNLSSKKQEETALLNDMEITGQAFEDMQEQNVRLMQQLREKDDANFKLVSERIKLENVEKNLKEEKEIYVQQVRDWGDMLRSSYDNFYVFPMSHTFFFTCILFLAFDSCWETFVIEVTSIVPGNNCLTHKNR